MLRYGPRVLHALVFSACVGGTGAASAASFKYTALNTDGANLVTPLAISAKDQVVGFAYNDGNERTGVLWSDGLLTIVDGTDELTAINDEGVAVGEWPGGNSTPGYASYDISTGTVSYIPLQFKQGQRGEITAEGINNAGVVVGVIGKRGKAIGFDGATDEILPPKEKQSFPLGINKSGDILIRCGFSYYDPFLYHKGKFTQFAVPGASATQPIFITDSGTIGGIAGVAGAVVGFIKSGNAYTTYSPPGSTYTTVTGVGPSGQIYGTFTDASGTAHGFENANGAYYQIDVPNSASTSISGVGTSGTIFGIYTDSGGSYGFIGKCGKKDVCTQ